MTGSQHDIRGSAELTARLLWFRSDHPDAEIETELVVAETEMAVCRTTLRTQSAGSASGHGSALRDEVGSRYVEVAEDRSLTRALVALGYGSPGIERNEDADIEPPSPPIDLVSARSLLREESSGREAVVPERRPQQLHETEPALEGDEPQSAESDDGADVNWNKFWSWARPRGYTSARELNELLGVDNVLAFTPREVRQMLVKYEMDNPPGGQEE